MVQKLSLKTKSLGVVKDERLLFVLYLVEDIVNGLVRMIEALAASKWVGPVALVGLLALAPRM